MLAIAGRQRLSVNSAAPTATTRLVGQFWGLDSDRVFEFFLRQIVFSQKVDVRPGGRRPMGLPPLAKAEPAMAHPFVGSLFIAFLAFALLSWLYFFIAPLIIEGMVALLLGFAYASSRRKRILPSSGQSTV